MTTELTAITEEPKEEKALTKITNYMESQIVRARFAQMMGERGASTYINSILLAVAEQSALQKCTPVSIYTQALRAGTLRLSVDPGIGQAYLVPFGDRATLIVGYKGLHDMAVRTGKYDWIHVGPIYEGEEVIEDRLSGRMRIETKTGFHRTTGSDDQANGRKVIGWIGAFRMKNGYDKALYMTVEEIHEHARQYSKSYNSGPWQTETAKMERKTVLRLLLRRWGYMDPSDVQEVDRLEDDAHGPAVDDEFNQLAETLEEREPVIEIIETTDGWAVAQAAREWNISASKAKTQLEEAKLGKMSKEDFLVWIKDPKAGEQQ